VEQKNIDCPPVEQSRTIRIEADAIRTLVAIAMFASLAARADAALTIEQSRMLHPAISLEHQDAISWLLCSAELPATPFVHFTSAFRLQTRGVAAPQSFVFPRSTGVMRRLV